MLARIARTLAVVAVFAAALVAPGLVPAAHAYDAGTCSSGYDDVDTVRIDTGTSGNVDFGDDYHIGGVPQGNGVVCWGHDRTSVYLKGKLFWDSYGAGCADAVVQTYDTSSNLLSYQDFSEVCSYGGLASKVIDHYASSSSGKLDRIRISLYRREFDRSRTLVHVSNRYYGD